jgi:enamine deaminase RidA (YjgF/YER057c/UK114 family)
MNAEARIIELGLKLPPPPEPTGLYRPMVLLENVAYVSGHGPMREDGSFILGRVGEDLGQEAGYRAARATGLAILATLRREFGSLDRIRRVVKLLGMVNCTPEFGQHPEVINGCSRLFSEVFGPEAGVGARSAVGVGSLPMGIPVEVEAIFEVYEK